MTNNSLKILAIGIVIASIYFLYNKDEEGIEIAEIETNQNEVVVGEKAINTNDREKLEEKIHTNGENASIEPISYNEYLKKVGITFSSPVDTTPIKKISADNDDLLENLRKYGNEAGKIIENTTLDATFQLDSFDNFLKEPKKSSFIKNMSKIADSYIAISNLLEEIDAPAQVSLAHEELFDVYKEVGEAVTTFSEDFSSGGDPIKVTQSYTSVISKFPDAFLGVATLLRAYGVKFRDSEPGSVFTLSL